MFIKTSGEELTNNNRQIIRNPWLQMKRSINQFHRGPSMIHAMILVLPREDGTDGHGLNMGGRAKLYYSVLTGDGFVPELMVSN